MFFKFFCGQDVLVEIIGIEPMSVIAKIVRAQFMKGAIAVLPLNYISKLYLINACLAPLPNPNYFRYEICYPLTIASHSVVLSPQIKFLQGA